MSEEIFELLKEIREKVEYLEKEAKNLKKSLNHTEKPEREASIRGDPKVTIFR